MPTDQHKRSEDMKMLVGHHLSEYGLPCQLQHTTASLQLQLIGRLLAVPQHSSSTYKLLDLSISPSKQYRSFRPSTTVKTKRFPPLHHKKIQRLSIKYCTDIVTTGDSKRDIITC